MSFAQVYLRKREREILRHWHYFIRIKNFNRLKMTNKFVMNKKMVTTIPLKGTKVQTVVSNMWRATTYVQWCTNFFDHFMLYGLRYLPIEKQKKSLNKTWKNLKSALSSFSFHSFYSVRLRCSLHLAQILLHIKYQKIER